MTALLVLTFLLLLVSVLAKARAGLRVGLGVDLATVAELVFALIVGVAALGSRALEGAAAMAWLVPAGVFMVLASTTLFGLRLRRYRSRQERLESKRLESYVKYFHRVDEPPESED